MARALCRAALCLALVHAANSFVPSRTGRAFAPISARQSEPEDEEGELDMLTRFQRELNKFQYNRDTPDEIKQFGAWQEREAARAENSTRPKYVAEEETAEETDDDDETTAGSDGASVASSALSEDAREPPPAETTQAAEPAKPFQLIDTEAVADKLQFKNPFPRIFKGPPPALQELTQKYAEWEEQASEKATPAESAAKEPEPDA